jgi:hypothetical protein
MKKIFLVILLIALTSCRETTIDEPQGQLVSVEEPKISTKVEEPFRGTDEPKIPTKPLVNKPKLQEPSKIKVCIFTFDEKDRAYIDTYAFEYKKICEKWEVFKPIHKFLREEYTVEMSQNGVFVAAQYGGQGRIMVNDIYKKDTDIDVTLAHEVTHSAHDGLYPPTWLSEGLATYFEWKFRGNVASLHPVYFGDLANWQGNSASYDIKQYIHSGYIIKSLAEKQGEEVITLLLTELQGKMWHTDSNDVKNEKILTALRKVTENEELTLKEVFHPKR